MLDRKTYSTALLHHFQNPLRVFSTLGYHFQTNLDDGAHFLRLCCIRQKLDLLRVQQGTTTTSFVEIDLILVMVIPFRTLKEKDLSWMKHFPDL